MIPNAPKTSSSVLNSIGNDVKKGMNKAVGDVAKTLSIHDFYSAHVLNYCEVSSHTNLEPIYMITDRSATTGLLHSVTPFQFQLSP